MTPADKTVEGPSAVLRDISAVAEWIGLSASVIKSGEPWTDTCDRVRDAARDALGRLGERALTAPPPAVGVWALVEALVRIREATPGNTNSRSAESMASWTHAVAAEALASLSPVLGGGPDPSGGEG